MRRVADFANGVEGPVIGQRLNDEGLAERRLPTRDDLDDVIGDRPVLIYRYCGHIAVANSAALSLAGVDGDSADPEGGSFDRDPGGRPMGCFEGDGDPDRLVGDRPAGYRASGLGHPARPRRSHQDGHRIRDRDRLGGRAALVRCPRRARRPVSSCPGPAHRCRRPGHCLRHPSAGRGRREDPQHAGQDPLPRLEGLRRRQFRGPYRGHARAIRRSTRYQGHRSARSRSMP